MNKREIGARYELLAASYLESCGYTILERNFRCRYGEIDLVAADEAGEQPVLVFVEVKYRSSAAYGYGEEAVDVRKQKTIRKAASFYLTRYRVKNSTPCRFDVIVFEGVRMRHYEDAF